LQSNTHAAAAYYHQQGFRPVPIPAKEKGPRIKDWPNYQFDAATSARDFPAGCNIGLIMGAGIVCVDLDHESVLAIADQFLPPTGCVIGRPGRPRCHWFYRLADGELLPSKGWKAKVDGKAVNLIDLLSDGKQVVVGPSVHPSDDVYDALQGGLATVAPDDLMAAIAALVIEAGGAAPIAPMRHAGPEPVAAPVDGIEQSPYYFDADSVDDDDRPGDEFNAEHPGPLLIRHGWTQVKGGDNEHWRRPGKTEGASATLKNINGKWKLYVFSSNAAPLDQGRGYDPLGLLAAFEHGGSITAAVAALHPTANAPQKIASQPQPQKVSAPVATAFPVDEPFPADCLSPPGFLGDLIAYNLAAAGAPQPILALAAALAALSAITDRVVGRIAEWTYTNLYVLGLGRTGSGKEFGRAVNKDLFAAAGLEDRLPGDGVGSAPGIIGALVKSNAALLQIDEIGDLFRSMTSVRSAAYISQISPMLKQIKTSVGKKWQSPVLKDVANNHTIYSPHLVIYGTSLVAGMLETLTAQQLSDGLMSRFVLFDADLAKELNERPLSLAPPIIPAALVDLAKAWAKLDTGQTPTGLSQGVIHKVISCDPAALDQLVIHRRKIHARRVGEVCSGDGERSDLWSRTAEKAAAFALLFACSRATSNDLSSGKLPTVSLDDANLAIKLANYLTRRASYLINKHVSSGEWDGKLKKAMEKLGPGKVLLRDWRRRCGHFAKGEFDSALKELQAANRIDAEQEKTAGRPRLWVSACEGK